jgi:hypothetical protein
MKTEEEEKKARYERHLRALKRAKKILKPGDRIRAEGGCRRKSTITFAGWDGNWIVSKSGRCDYSPGSVDKLNGVSVDWEK